MIGDTSVCKFNIVKSYQPYYTRFADVIKFFFQWSYFVAKENISMFFLLYFFSFKDLIYKWIKKFENLQENNANPYLYLNIKM